MTEVERLTTDLQIALAERNASRAEIDRLSSEVAALLNVKACMMNENVLMGMARDEYARQNAALRKALEPALKALKEDDDNLRYERHRMKDDDCLSVEIEVGPLRHALAATAGDGEPRPFNPFGRPTVIEP